MPARDEQGDRRRPQTVDVVGDEVDGDVGGEMVDAVERQPERRGQTLRGAHADHERPGQSGSCGHRDRVEIAEGDPGLIARGDDRGTDRLDVGAGGDLGDDTAEPDVVVHRRRHRVRQQRAPAHDAHPGLVARGFDAEDEGVAHRLSVPRCGSPTRASSGSAVPRSSRSGSPRSSSAASSTSSSRSA